MTEHESSETLDRKQKVMLPFLGLDFRSARKRILDFREVTIPFDESRAKFEALRCIDCPDPPCVQGCPVHNNIPLAMAHAAKGDFLTSADVFRKTSNMPEICGRVCPQEQLCQGSCVLNHSGEPVLIGAIEAYVSDKALAAGSQTMQKAPPTGKKAAVIGAGPAGLSCAEELVILGHDVTVFETKKEAGGLLMFGIPGFKLNSTIVKQKIAQLKELGIRFIFDICIGSDKTVDDLLDEGFDAIFIGVGAGVDSPIKIPGENLPGIYNATEFLLRANVEPELLPPQMRSLPEVGKRVVVIGGGDTSADCVRTAKRLGAEEVICVYRRTEDEMPGVDKDRELAREEGVEYLFLTQPVKFTAGEDGRVAQIESVKMQLDEPDEKGRRKPVPIEGSNFVTQADTVVLAIGYQPYPTIGDTTPGLETHRWGLIVVDENFASTRPGVFAGGDAINGPDLVVTAIADARRAAAAIDQYLTGKH